MTMQHTLLLVDDEENILNSLRRLFRREGYTILTATSGAEGLELLAQNEVSLIMSDQRMPQMTGAEFLAKSREIAPHCIRIMLTGYSDLEAATEAVNRGGISRYITKPWNDDEISQIVRDALRQIELERENKQLTIELQQKNKELEDFNARLEKAVRQRTRELQLKVKELEGKDRIAQHMLSVHSIEETLELVLQVVGEIIEMDRAVIYLSAQGETKAVATLGDLGTISQKGELNNIPLSPIHKKAFARVEATRKPVNIKDTKDLPIPPFAVVPILRGEEFLGLIEVANPQSQTPISVDELDVVASFALQAAMAISDAQAHGDIGAWKGEIADILKDLDL
jgi:DNA-binding response OmpR family regulator